MDILIKNIELKGSLLLTPKAIFKPVEEYDNEKIVQKWEIVKDAEIVPVPEHGDLGDLSELSMTLYSELEAHAPKTLGEVMTIIKKVFDEAEVVLERTT